MFRNWRVIIDLALIVPIIHRVVDAQTWEEAAIWVHAPE